MDAELRLSLIEPGASAEELETAGGSVREELLALDVASVRPIPAGPAPDGTRGLDAATLGAMLVSLPATPPVLAAVVDVLRRWIGRRSDGDRSVRIEIAGDSLELSRVSDEQQTQLIEDWLSRRTAAPTAPTATTTPGTTTSGGDGGEHA